MIGPSVAIGVMAHNEASNVGRLVDRLLAVELAGASAVRIVIVASGCTDDTLAVARRAAGNDPRVTVVVDPERRGKAVAINQFITAAQGADLLVMESADTLPEPGAIAALVARLADPSVGMVGARPVRRRSSASPISSSGGCTMPSRPTHRSRASSWRGGT